MVFIRFLCGWSRCSDSLQTAGGSAVTNSAKSLLIAVFLCLHPNITAHKIVKNSRIICRFFGDFYDDGYCELQWLFFVFHTLTVAKSRLYTLLNRLLTHHATWRCWRRVNTKSSSGNSKFIWTWHTGFLSSRHTALSWFLMKLKQKRNNWRHLLPGAVNTATSPFERTATSLQYCMCECVCVFAVMYCSTIRGTRDGGLLVDISNVCWLWAV